MKPGQEVVKVKDVFESQYVMNEQGNAEPAIK